MKNLLIILALMIISASLVSGQPKRAAASKMAGCAALAWDWDPKDWDVGQKLPKELNKEDLVKLLRPAARFSKEISPLGETVLGVGVKPWKYLPGASIVVVETDVRVANAYGGSDSTGRNLSIAVINYTPGSSTYKVLAKTTEPFKLENRFMFNKFDLAAYKLSETEYAFGLRRCVINTGTGAITSYEALDLFKLSNENIDRILSTATLYETSMLRGKGNETLKTATISVAPEKTGDYFNLVKTFGKTKPTVFQWDGKSYQTKDKDPLTQMVEAEQ